MIGTLNTGTLPGIVICATSHEGLQVLANGKPARLAVVDDSGQVLVAGEQVAREAEAVAVASFKQAMMGRGYLRVLGGPIVTA